MSADRSVTGWTATTDLHRTSSAEECLNSSLPCFDRAWLSSRRFFCLTRRLRAWTAKPIRCCRFAAHRRLRPTCCFQATLRTRFSHATVITIAHRFVPLLFVAFLHSACWLNTILDSSRILVLQSGKVSRAVLDTAECMLCRLSSSTRRALCCPTRTVSESSLTVACLMHSCVNTGVFAGMHKSMQESVAQ